MQALEVIVDAFERCNRLSPGETLDPDSAAFGFRRLNAFIDELGAQPSFLFKNVITTVTQGGHITLGAGSWAAVAPGTEIISLAADGWLMHPITVAQYNALPVLTDTGTPDRYAPDGLSTVYLYPVPTSSVLRMQTRVTVSAFADQETDYTLAPGWFSALASGLAVQIAPNILGQIPPSLIANARRCLSAVDTYRPAAVDVYSFMRSGCRSNIVQGA